MNSNVERLRLTLLEDQQRAIDESGYNSPDEYQFMTEKERRKAAAFDEAEYIGSNYKKISGMGGMGAHLLGRVNQVSDLLGSFAPIAQSALASISSVSQNATDAAVRQQRGLARDTHTALSVFRKGMNTAFSLNLAKSAFLGGSVINPTMGVGAAAIGGISLLSSLAKRMTDTKTRGRRQQTTALQKRYSSSNILEQQYYNIQAQQSNQIPTKDPQYTMIHILGQILSYQQLSAISNIHASGSATYIRFIYEHLKMKEDIKGVDTADLEESVMETMYGRGYDKSGLSKSLDVLAVGLENIQEKFDPLYQVTKFLFRGQLPGQSDTGDESRNEREYIRSVQLAKGIGNSESRLVIGDVSQFTTGQSYEAKMLGATMGLLAMSQLQAKEAITMRHGMGIAKNAFNQMPDYEEGIFGKMVRGLENTIMSIPGLSALYNMTKTVFTLPMIMSDKLSDSVDWLKTALFGQEFVDLQDNEELDKRLGLYKSTQDRAYEFMGKGMPTELKKQTTVAYEQLAVLKNTYDVTNLMYQIQSKGETHAYSDDYYKKEREAKYWDPFEGRYVNEKTANLLADNRMRMRKNEKEGAFARSGAGKLTNMFEMFKAVIGGASKAAGGEIGSVKDLTGHINRSQKSNEDRMKSSTSLFNMLELFAGGQNPIQTDDMYEQNQKSSDLLNILPTEGLQDQLFSIKSARMQRENQMGMAGKLRRGKRSVKGGLTSLILGAAGAALPGMILPLLAGSAGGLYGGLQTHTKKVDRMTRFNEMGLNEFKDVEHGSGRYNEDDLAKLRSEQESAKVTNRSIIDPAKLRDITKGDSEKQDKILEELIKGNIIIQDVRDEIELVDTSINIVNDSLNNLGLRTDSIHELLKSGISDDLKTTNRILEDILLATRIKGTENLPIRVKLDQIEVDYLKDIKSGLVADDYRTSVVDILENMNADDYDKDEAINPMVLQMMFKGMLSQRISTEMMKSIIASVLVGQRGRRRQGPGAAAAYAGADNIPEGLSIIGEGIPGTKRKGVQPEFVFRRGGQVKVIGTEETNLIAKLLDIEPSDLPNALGIPGFAGGTGRLSMRERLANARTQVGNIKDSASGMLENIGGGSSIPFLMGAAGLGLGAMTGGLGFGLMAGMSGLGLGFMGRMDSGLKKAFEQAEQAKKDADPNYQIQKWEDREKKSLLDKVGYKGVGALGGLGAMLLGGPLMGMAGGLLGGMMPGFIPGALVSGLGTGLGALMGPLAPILGATGAIAWMLKNREKAKKAKDLEDLMNRVSADKEKDWTTLSQEQKLVRLANEQHDIAKMRLDNDMVGLGDSTLTKVLKMTGGASIGLLAGGPLGMLWGLGAGGINSWFKGKKDKEKFLEDNGIQSIIETLKKGKENEETGEYTPYKDRELTKMYVDALSAKEELVEYVEKQKSDDAPEARASGGLIKPGSGKKKQYVVGEHGPELVETEEQGRVTPTNIFETLVDMSKKQVSKLMEVAQYSKEQVVKLSGLSGFFEKNFSDNIGEAIGSVIPIFGPMVGKSIAMLIDKGVDNIDFEKHLPTFSALFKKLKPKAKGGPFGGDDALLVGEAGPEIIQPGRPGNVIPATIFQEIAQYTAEIMDDTDKIVSILNEKKGFTFSLLHSGFSMPDLKELFSKLKISMPSLSMPDWKSIFSNIKFSMPSFSIPDWMKIFSGNGESKSWFSFPKFSLPDFKKMFSFGDGESKSWFSFPKFNMPDFKKLFDDAKSFFTFPKDLLDTMKDGAKKFWNKIESVAITVWKDIGKGAKTVWDAISSGAKGMWSNITGGAGKVWDSLSRGGDRFMKVLEGWNPMAMMDKVGKKMSDAFGKAKDKLVDMVTFKDVRSKIGNLFKSKSQKSDEAVTKQKVESEQDFWSGNLYWLEKIYHRLGGGSSTAGNVIGSIGARLGRGVGSLVSSGAKGIGSLFSGGGADVLDSAKEKFGNLLFDAQFKARGLKKKISHKFSGLTRTMGQELSELKDKAKEKLDVDFKSKIMDLVEQIAGNTDELENAESDKQKEEKKGGGIFGFLANISKYLPMLVSVLGPAIGMVMAYQTGGRFAGKAVGGWAGRKIAGAGNALAETKLGQKAIEKASGSGIGKFIGAGVEKLDGLAAKGMEFAGKIPIVGKIFSSLGPKLLAKMGIKLGQGGLKVALKKLPFGIGAIVGLGLGAQRLMSGDVIGAIGEVASGIASIFPGFGTAISLGIDGLLLWKDLKTGDDKKENTTKNIWETITTTMKEMAAGFFSHIPLVGDWLAKKIMGDDIKEKSESGWIKIISDEEINQGVTDIIEQHPVVRVAKYIGYKIGDWFGEKWNKFKGMVDERFTWISDTFNTYIGEPLRTSFEWIKDKISDNPIFKFIMDVKGWFGEIIDTTTGFFGKIWNGVTNLPDTISKFVASKIPNSIKWMFGLEIEGEGVMDVVDKDLANRKYGERGVIEVKKLKKEKMLGRLKETMHPEAFKKINNNPEKLFDLMQKGIIEEHFFGPYKYTLTKEEMATIKKLDEDKMFSNLKNEKDRTRLKDMKDKMEEDAFKLLGGQPDKFQTLLEDGKIKKRFWSFDDFYELTDKGKEDLKNQNKKRDEKKQSGLKFDGNKAPSGPTTIQTESGIKIHTPGASAKYMPKIKQMGGNVVNTGRDVINDVMDSDFADASRKGIDNIMNSDFADAGKDMMNQAVNSGRSVMDNITELGENALDTSVGNAVKEAYNKGTDLVKEGVEAAKLTKDKLSDIAGSAADKYYSPLNDTMNKHNIDSPIRQAHFLSQLMHESGNFKYSSELASGAAYEGRKDLGNTQPGDGVKFKGRGLIQLTGKDNYNKFGDYLGKDLLTNPEIVATDPKLSAEAAGWYWDKKNLNKYADQDNIQEVTRRINGGFNGIDERMKYLKLAKDQMNITQSSNSTSPTQSSDINKKSNKVTLPGMNESINLGGGFKWPSKHNIIVSPFGPRKVKKGSSNHKGVDIRAKIGDPIFAALPGKVATAKLNPWGNIVLDHGSGIQTRYLHNSELSVKPGDSVNAGDRIASAGGRGKEGPNSYSPHLHFEVLKGGNPVDPEMFIHNLNPGWHPQYSPDITESRQLNAKLGGKSAPGKEEKEAGGFDIFGQMSNMSKNVIDVGMPTSIDGVKGYDWITNVKDMMNEMIDKVGKLASNTIKESVKPKTQDKIDLNVDGGTNRMLSGRNRQGSYKKENTSIDPYLDNVISHIFDNVANAFVTGISDYSFTNTMEHSLY